MVVEFECRSRLPVGLQEAFDRSRSIDLHLSSMAHSRERAIAGVRGGLIAEGEEVTWRAFHFGVPIRMTSRITRMSPPDSFVDEQVRGPFKSFWHEHRFVADGDGALMIDRVAFTHRSASSAGSPRSCSAPTCDDSSSSGTRTYARHPSRRKHPVT